MVMSLSRGFAERERGSGWGGGRGGVHRGFEGLMIGARRGLIHGRDGVTYHL